MRTLVFLALFAVAAVAEADPKAEQAARKAVEKNPKDVDAWLALADALVARGEPHDAWAMLADEALVALPDNLRLTTKLGEVFLEVAAKEAANQGDGTFIRSLYMDAERMFDTVLAEEPKNAAALYGKARANYQLSDVAERRAKAKEAVAACLQVDPKFAAAHALQADMLYAGARDIKDNASRLAKYAAAESKYETAVGLDTGTALWFVRLGHSRIAQGKRDEAKAAYLDALRHHPDDNTAILSGLTYLVGRDWKKMVDPLKEAAQVAPKSAPVFYYLGYAYFVNGMNGDAAEAFRKAVALNPNMPDALHYLGQTHEKRNEADKALDYYRRTLKVNPDHAGAAQSFHDLVLARANDIGWVEKRFEELIELAPSREQHMGFILNNYALVLRNWAESNGAAKESPPPVARRRIKRSGEIYEMAAAILPNEPQIQSDTGLLFQFYPCNRDPEKAKRYFARALELSDYVYRDAFDGLMKICYRTKDWRLLAEYAEGVIGAIERGRHAIAPVGGRPPAVIPAQTPGLRARAERALRTARAKLAEKTDKSE